jgi:4-aminobutyrate aminotransferase-like enzyme
MGQCLLKPDRNKLLADQMASEKILDLNAFDMTSKADLSAETQELIARRQRTFGPTSMLFYRRPIHVVRGEGAYLFGPNGERYLDAYNNVPSVGHSNPRVAEAVAKALTVLNTNTRYLYDSIYSYAENLLATFPAELSNIVFTCTGSESIDLALRVARNVTGERGFIATDNAYHGNTTTATEISPSSANAERANPAITFIPPPDTYRRPNGEAERQFAADVEEAILRLKGRGFGLAGFIADSIFSSDGVYPGQPGFLQPVVDIVHRAGGLYIADEVQPGFARTGEAMWGFMRHGMTPDIVVMGKPMGNGYPVGATVVRPDLLAEFGGQSGYFNTFGGTPAAAAAGQAVLDCIRNDCLQEHARDVGTYLKTEIQKFGSAIGDVRGAGLYLGVEFVTDAQSKEPNKAKALSVVNGMRERGVLIGTAGKSGNILKIRPPLCFDRSDADTLVKAMRGALGDA